MYVCMYVCIYVCMYVHTYVLTYVCMYGNDVSVLPLPSFLKSFQIGVESTTLSKYSPAPTWVCHVLLVERVHLFAIILLFSELSGHSPMSRGELRLPLAGLRCDPLRRIVKTQEKNPYLRPPALHGDSFTGVLVHPDRTQILNKDLNGGIY